MVADREPCGRGDVATPAVRVPVPSEVVPSKKLDGAVGVPAPGALGVTVAVKVTDWPKTDGPGRR